MNNKIDEIISELIKLDPTFAGREDELKKILLSILALKPNPVIDPEFVQKLKMELAEKLESKPAYSFSWFKFAMPATAVVVLAVVVFAAQFYYRSGMNKKLLSFGADVRITRAQANAFGNLATLTATGGKGGGGNASAAPMSLAADTKMAPATGIGGGGVDSSFAPYEPVSYKYVYKGEELNLTSDKLDVLKKQTPDTSSLVSSLSSLGLGLVSLDSFPASKLQSISFNQDNGYNLYVDLNSGSISISGYFGIMPYATTDASVAPMDLRCIEASSTCGGGPAPISESDIPDDATLISISNQFLSAHSIATSAFGNPEVMNDYRIQNETLLKAEPKSLVYWPETITVVYPLKVGDGEVFDESGSKTGLMVGVDIRNKKVTSVYNLSTQDYQSSSYDAETDSARILKIAQAGGMYGYLGDQSGKTIEIELGTPTIQYVQMWDYQQNSSQQLLVPSMIFPVLNKPDTQYFYQKAVVIPLIKQILDRAGGIGGPVKILETPTAAQPPTK
jgi:hypothetical protein